MKLFSFLLVLATASLLSLQSGASYEPETKLKEPALNLLFSDYSEATDFILDLEDQGNEVSYLGNVYEFDVADFSISVGDITINIMICGNCSGGGDSSGGSRRGAGGGAFFMVEPQV